MFTLIHIGKCAGQTVNKYLLHNKVRVDRIHARVPEIDRLQRTGVVVVLRDPIARIISAFNWRHPSTRPVDGKSCCPRMDHTELELAFYKCFDHVNEFAEALDEDSQCGSRARDALTKHMKHIGMGYEFYFAQDVMSTLEKHLVFVIHQEHLTQDLHDFLLWNNIKLTHDRIPVSHSADGAIYPKMNDTYLSQDGRNTLRAHLARDYAIYEKLERMSVDMSGTRRSVHTGSADLEVPRT
jgi:hypothetical protein